MEKNSKNQKEMELMETADADVEIHVIDDRDQQAESLIHWAAARAGVIVVAPMLGSVALMANEVYMISRIGSIYGVDISQKAVISFIGSLGATMLGMTVATLIPISLIQIPLGISITYGLGQAALKWIKDGMPNDTEPYKAVFEEGKKEGKSRIAEIENDENKDIPLGDEKKDFVKEQKEMNYSKKTHDVVDKMAENVSDVVDVLSAKLIKRLKEAGVTDEQIENVKYTALGAAEVVKEAAEKAGNDLKILAKEKSKEWKKDIGTKAADMKEQAKEHMEELKKRSEVQAEQARIKAEELKTQAKSRAEKLKEQVKEHMEDAKEKTEELREQAKVHMERAKGKTEEFKKQAKEHMEDAKEKAEELKEQAKENIENVQNKMEEVKKSATAYVDEFREKTKERAAQKAAEDKRKNDDRISETSSSNRGEKD